MDAWGSSFPPPALRGLVERADLRDREAVFQDRAHAGALLTRMLAPCADAPRVLAIPAGGVPVAVAVARQLDLPLGVAVVSKITPAWNSEAGYGAVAWDGTVRLNDELLRHFGLSEREITEDVQRARDKVRRRTRLLLRGRSWPDLGGGNVVLVDDGLASGFTMRVAVEAVRRAGAGGIIVAVPTGHARSVEYLLPLVDAVVCPNVRSGRDFAVADAYEHWSDLDDRDVASLLGVDTAPTARSA